MGSQDPGLRSASAMTPQVTPAGGLFASRAASSSAAATPSPLPNRLSLNMSAAALGVSTPPASARSTTPTTPLPPGAPAPSPRKDRHRKSLSTSVVPDTPRHRRTLSSVDENMNAVRDPHTALEDLRSLRSSGRRRLRALRDLECALAAACTGDTSDMAAYVSLQAHVPLLALLGRHTASLAKRASTSSLPAGDELARHLAPEIDTALGILQGLTLLSKACKTAVGERWTMEMFLDLLLLLRTQPPEGSARPTVYALLDLLFCVLVDSPEHARMFEDLQGLEAVTRVLRGTGVAKDVRMKCCEFLYFYLLPEGSTTMPDAYNLPGLPGSRSTSGSSISSAAGFPPGETSAALAPQDVTQSVLPSPSHSRVNSIDGPMRPISPERDGGGWNDLADLPFIPETPRKPAKPSLGFQTPSANRRVSGSSSVTVLTPVAQSPDDRRRRPTGESDAGSASRTSSGSSSGSSIAKGPRQLFKDREATPLGTPPAPSPARGQGLPQARDVSAGLGRRPSKRAPGSSTGPGSAAKSPLGQPSTSTPDSARRHSRSQSASTPAATPGRDRQRSRGFPSELTRGVLPSSASGAGGGSGSAGALTPTRRIPTDHSRDPTRNPSTRSVAEKKEMLGAWLGNVDQLVQGVEKVGFFAKKDGENAGASA